MRTLLLTGTIIQQVELQAGSKIETLALPASLTRLVLRGLKHLTTLSVAGYSNIQTVHIEDTDVDAFGILASIYAASEVLTYIRILWLGIYVDTTRAAVNMLPTLAQPQYKGLAADGATVLDKPFIEGTIDVSAGGLTASNIADLQLDIEHQEDYDGNIKKVLARVFNTSLYLLYDSTKIYITFADPEAERVCVAKFSTDGVGVTIADAVAKAFSGTFNGNQLISTFDEGVYFSNSRSWQGAFNGSTVTRVKMPMGIRCTNSSAWSGIFYGCSLLQEIDFADMERLPEADGAQFQWFTSCSALTTVHFKSIEQICKFICNRQMGSDVPFWYNNGTHRVYVNGEELLNVVIPSTITTIRPSTFYRFNRITSVTFPSSVTEIGQSAFQGCSGLTGTIALPQNLQTIGANAFAGTQISGELQLPSSLTSIGNYAFDNLTGITGTLNVPASAACGDQCFSRLTGITNLVFNADTTSNPFRHDNGIGNGTGLAVFHGSLNYNYGSCNLRFKEVVIDENFSKSVNYGLNNAIIEIIRVGGNVDISVTQGNHSGFMYFNGSKLAFVEMMGTVASNQGEMFNDARKCANGIIIHLGYDAVTNNALPCAPSVVSASNSRVAKIYVGDGSSASHDNAILDKYRADTDWAQYSSKLDTWYNYINDPDANPDYIN